MGVFNIKQSKVYDVCIIGSGAGGGMAAYMLTKAGANVVMLEAGGDFDSAKGDMLKWNYESPRRGAGTYKPFGDFDACEGGWKIEGEPYSNKEGTDFMWFRARMLGGRTNHWGRISLRFGPNDFKRKSMDGIGDDWPISYDDIKPYYDKVDQLIGVFGQKEGMYNEPDGIFLPPPKARAHELLIKKGAEKVGVKISSSRLSILTQAMNGRAACHYCAECNRGCSTHSNFSSPSVLIRPALETGKLDMVLNAMAREVLTDKEGKATGVSYVNTKDLSEHQINAKIVIIAASACESARLLLNSKSSAHPNGLANSSNVVGKYLMDTVGARQSAIIPALIDRTRYNEDGVGGGHIYSPWWLDNKKLDFPRGYHIEYGGGMGMPGYGFMSNIHDLNNKLGDNRPKGGGGYGLQLKNDYRRLYGATIGMAGRGEGIAFKENYCEIDPKMVDKYGIPTLRFNYKWSDFEIKQAKHMHETFEEIIHQMGAIQLSPTPTKEQNYGISKPGEIIHEVGTARMGNDPKTSALNQFCQVHDAKNVFVVDGAAFVSQADKNPTWTILALAMRASEYIMEQKKQNIL